MSSVDNRVVHMQFDNKQFESGVRTTLSTLAKLKEALDFKKGGFDALQRSVNGVSLSPLGDQVYTVQQKFSLLGEFVKNVFDRISNKVIDVASTMGKALTIEPLTDGFDEYQLKMDSVKTIMASTGESLETVNGYLDDLNSYADKTIYSFSDMTASIGKFTNSGVKLDDAVAAIKGISNEAALAGANTQQASHAMYNFAQALSSGSVKLIDWKSIENANMATIGFKEQLIQTAVAMGTLRKEGDKYVSTTTDLNGKVSDAFTASQGFNDSLSAQWMTTDVLVQTLGNYATDIREMTDAEKAAYEEKLRGIGYTEDQIKAIEELGIAAADAATEVTTWKQLVDTIKEGLGSGWAQSFEYIFGNFVEAKKLWTAVKDEIESVINPIADARNEMLKFWHDAGDKGGRLTAIEAIGTSWKTVKTVLGEVGSMFGKVFKPITGQTLVDITNHVAELANKFRDVATDANNLLKIRQIALGVASAFKMGLGAVKGFWDLTAPLRQVVKDTAGDLFDLAAHVGIFIASMANAKNPLKYFIDNLAGFGFQGQNLYSVVLHAAEVVETFVQRLLSLVNININGTPFTDLISRIHDFASQHLHFPSFETLSSFAQTALDTLSRLGNFISNVLNGALSGLGSLLDFVLRPLGASKDALDKVGESVDTATRSFDGLGFAQKALGGFAGFIATVGGKIATFASGIAEKIPHIFEYLGSPALRGIIENFNLLLTGGLINSLRKFFDALRDSDGADKGGFWSIVDSLKESVNGVLDNAADVVEKFGSVLDGLKGSLSAFTNSINASALLKIAVAIGVLVASIAVIGNMDASKMANGIAGIATALGVLIAGFKALNSGSGLVAAQGISTLGTALIKMALAIGILAVAMKALSDLSMDELVTGLVGIGGAMALMVVAVAGLAHFGGAIETSATGMITLALAVRVLASAVNAMSSLSWEGLAKGLVGVGVLLAEVLVFANMFNGNALKGAGLMTIAVGMLAIVAAIKLLESSVASFATMSWEEIGKGLAGVGGLLLSLGVYSKLLSTGGLTLRATVGLLATVYAIKQLEETVSMFAGMNWEDFGRGLAGVAALLVEIGVFSAAMKGNTMSVVSALSLVVMANAIASVAEVMRSIGRMSWENLGRGLVGLVGSLVSMTAALSVLGMNAGGALAGAAAIMILSTALRVFIPVVQTLSTMSVGEIVKGLVALAAAMGVLGVSGVVLGIVAPLLLDGSIALAAFGAACIVAAAGITALTLAMALGAASIVAGASTIYVGVLTIITSVAVGIANGITQFAVTILNNIGIVLVALGTALHAIGDFLIANGPYIISIGVQLINDVLQVAVASIPQFIAVVSMLAIALIQAIVTWVPALANTLVTGAVTLANSLADGIRNSAPQILAAIRNIVSASVELILTALADIVSLIPGVGPMLADKIEGAKDVVRAHLAPESLGAIGKGAVDGVTSGVDAASSGLQNAAESAANGVRERFESSLSDGTTVASGYTDDILSVLLGAEGSFSNAGDIDVNAFLSKFSDTDLASLAGSGLNDATVTSLLEGSEAYGTAADVDVNAFVNGFSNTDLASAAGLNLNGAALESLSSGVPEYEAAGAGSLNEWLSSFERPDEASAAGITTAGAGAEGAASQDPAYRSAGTSNATSYTSAISKMSAAARAGGSTMSRSGAGGAASEAGSWSGAASSNSGRYTATLGSASAFSHGAGLSRSGASGAYSGSGEFSSAGSYAASGFASGILSGVGGVISAARSIAQSALSTLKATIQSASPSKVTMKYGGWFSEGFAVGIENLANYAERSSERLGQKTLGALSTSVEAISDYAKMDYDIDPTIRPVLDLTDIQNGVSQANSLVGSINSSIPLELGDASYARDIFGGIGDVNYSEMLADKFDAMVDANREAMQQFAANAIDYELLGVSVSNALIRSGVHVEMDGGQLMGYLAGEIADARRMYG